MLITIAWTRFRKRRFLDFSALCWVLFSASRRSKKTWFGMLKCYTQACVVSGKMRLARDDSTRMPVWSTQKTIEK